MVLKAQIPLLNDHHNHPYLYAALTDGINLSSVQTKAEALSLIRNAGTEMIVAFGWNDSLYDLTIEDFRPGTPTVLLNRSLHSFMMNESAIEVLKATHGIVIARRNDRNWVEKHFPHVLHFIMDLKTGSDENLKTFYHDLLGQGVWHVDEMSLKGEREIDFLISFDLLKRTRLWSDPETFGKLAPAYQRRVYGIKLFSDGALGAKTAMLEQPYINGKKGVLVYSDSELLQRIEEVAALDKAVSIHAIGDQALDQVTRILAALRNRGIAAEIRIEHCQFISQDAAERAKALGVCLSMQPNFSMESLHYRDRLPESYCLRNNPFRMLIDEIGFVPGKDLLFGSDGMPCGAKHALESALFPPLQSQRLTLDEFIAGYCISDDKHGFIEVRIDEDEQTIITHAIAKERETEGL